ncbi:MAG: YitT family protein [Eubacteriales bacterium]
MNFKQHAIKFTKDSFIDFAGGFLIAMGIYNFSVHAQFPMTGVSGIALIFYHLFGLPIGALTMLFNVPIILGCYKILGRDFFITSLKTIIITSLVVDYIAPFIPLYYGDIMLAAICTGVFSGLGYAMIYMNNTSTGGMDFVIMSIRAKHPHLSIGKISFVTDVTIVLLGGFIYKNIDGIIYGIIICYLQSFVIDKLMYGIDSGKMTFIVTDSGDDMASMISHVTGRGATLLKGVGSYSKDDKSVVMCACNNKQMFQIKKLAKKVDPSSFTVIMESNEVLGEGFKDS